MRLNFLCASERQNLLRNPANAKAAWDMFLERLLDTDYAVTPYRVRLAGSAMEAAEIHLMDNPVSSNKSLHRYTTCAVSLLEMLTELGKTRLAIIVAARSMALLEHVACESGYHEAALAQTEEIMAAASVIGGAPPDTSDQLRRVSTARPGVPLLVTVE